VDAVKIALVVKPSRSTEERENRNMGYWSYPVEGLQWAHFVFGGKVAYATDMNKYDVIVQEDAGPRFYKHLKKPVVYIAIDSSLSDDHLKARLERARHADLILVDHDRLDRFASLGVPVRRLNYCINDHLMRDYGEDRIIDVSYHCGSSYCPDRKRLRKILAEFCRDANLEFASGVLHITDYARSMARSKIVVNWPRVPSNRPHRVFDAMACGACLVTGPLPDVDGDKREAGKHYIEVEKLEDIPAVILALLDSGEWRTVGQSGREMVNKYHTWAVRAGQLREILHNELGL
jgi:hypothetical protein